MMTHPKKASEVTDSNPSRERRESRRRWLRFYELASAPSVFLVVVAGLLLEPGPTAREAVPPPPRHDASPSSDRDASGLQELLCVVVAGSSRVGA